MHTHTHTHTHTCTCTCHMHVHMHMHVHVHVQVDAFLASEEGAEFAPVPPAELAAFSGLADLATAAPLLDARGFMRLTPARHGCDGFFAAALRRREGGWSGRAGARGGSKGRRRRAR